MNDSTPPSQLEKAIGALKREDFVSARDLFITQASLGSKRALLGLAAIYERGGHGVLQDLAAARSWYERALAEANSSAAALALGKMYYRGIGVEPDYQRAFYYYNKMANDQQPVALFWLGVMYELGKGTTKDLRRARDFYSRSAKLGSIYARKNLGVLEVRNGNPLGFLFWVSAFFQGVALGVFDRNNRRLKT